MKGGGADGAGLVTARQSKLVTVPEEDERCKFFKS